MGSLKKRGYEYPGRRLSPHESEDGLVIRNRRVVLSAHAQDSYALSSLKALKKNFPAVSEANSIAMDEGFSTLLNKNDFFNLSHSEKLLRPLRDIVQQKLRARRHANGGHGGRK
jgi:hypothetical protein